MSHYAYTSNQLCQMFFGIVASHVCTHQQDHLPQQTTIVHACVDAVFPCSLASEIELYKHIEAPALALAQIICLSQPGGALAEPKHFESYTLGHNLFSIRFILDYNIINDEKILRADTLRRAIR